VFTEENFDETWAKLEHTPQKSLRCLAQEAGISKLSTALATKLHQLRPYKATVVRVLQPRDLTSRMNFCKWILQ
jgi:hypothetical protein